MSSFREEAVGRWGLERVGGQHEPALDGVSRHLGQRVAHEDVGVEVEGGVGAGGEEVATGATA